MAWVCMITFLLTFVATVSIGVTLSTGFCDYPTYFDSVSDGCVLTCPAGTIGNVNRTTNVIMRNCTSLSPGYVAVFNATEYEFDVNVYSPVGTVVFEALIFAENPNNVYTMSAAFRGSEVNHGPYSINGMDDSTVVNPIRSNNLLTIRMNETLDPNDNEAIYEFILTAVALNFQFVVTELQVRVILNEIDPCNGCVRNSTCEPQPDGSVVCICPSGYNGTDCNNFIGSCHSDPCMNGGICTEIVGNFTCTCVPPVTGRFCEVDPDDECNPDPCVNGNCTDLINSYSCTCFDGFTDQDCSTKIDDRISNPCMNNGSCIDGINTFTCNCTGPWIGSTDGIDDCIDIDCNNGSCVDLVDDFHCNCNSGFTGRFCEININDCENITCLNNGTCVDHINDFMCQCSPGYEGRFCEININDCENITCLNNGTCVDHINDFMCQCSPGYEGRFCEININDCENITCLNNGTCVDHINDFMCQCSPGYEDRFCSNTTNECDPDPCVSGQGDCEDLFLDYRCNCRPDFIGRNCSTRFNNCLSEPCQNNTACTSVLNKNCNSEGGSDSSEGSFLIVIIIASVVGIVILALLLICCILVVVYHKRKKTQKTAEISKSTMEMTEDDCRLPSGPSNKNVTDTSESVENTTFIQPEPNESSSIDANSTKAAQAYAYLSDIIVEVGQTKAATRDDYENEALYTKMTRHYNNLDYSSIQSKEIPRNKLTLLDQLGKGEFGRVLKGIGREIIAGESETLVAVKMLKEGASYDSKKDFLGEAQLLSQFNHPNVLTLLGVVTTDDPVLIITPYMKNGDLHTFLTSINTDKVKLSCADKLEIAVQIANGMEYLATKFYVHRDLAARNILVGEKLHVKISDFGMSRALANESTYYILSSAVKLPLKWMAVESIDQGKFTTFSDVWSFGIVVWEIFSYGMVPYKGISNICLPNHIRSGNRLAMPDDCNDEIYRQLMLQCWMERKERRPTFTELKKEIVALLNKEGKSPEFGDYVYML